VIPPEADADFVCQMEEVLSVYHRPFDAENPVICMDESPCQLVGETRQPFTDSRGAEHVDYEYVRKGVVSIFAALEPLAGKRLIRVRDHHKAEDWVEFMQEVAEGYQQARRITVVMDNLSTHKKGSFYKFLPPDQARALAEKFEFVYTPKHGSWLNIAEIELQVLKRQCLSRRLDSKETMMEQVNAWQQHRNNQIKTVDWQFSIEDARVKLKRLYPTILGGAEH
jgi:hypothetical protein